MSDKPGLRARLKLRKLQSRYAYESTQLKFQDGYLRIGRPKVLLTHGAIQWLRKICDIAEDAL